VRGFAFASFLSSPDAEKAIKAVNGQLLRKRPVAADWAIGKAQYEGLKGQQQQQQQQQPQKAAAGSSDDGSDGGSDDVSDGSDVGLEDEGSLSGTENGSEGASGSSEAEEDDSEVEIGMESDESAEDDVSESDDDAIGSDDDVSGSDDDVSSGSGEEEGEEGDAADPDVRAERDAVANALDAVLKQQQQDGAAGSKASKQQQQQQQPKAPQQQDAAPGAAAGFGGGSGAVSRTVFVRGLPLDATSQELQVGLIRVEVLPGMWAALQLLRACMDVPAVCCLQSSHSHTTQPWAKMACSWQHHGALPSLGDLTCTANVLLLTGAF
jgi:hypothetical protein